MKSPLTISYNDMIKYVESQVAFMERQYPAMVMQGRISANLADHNKACAKKLLLLLKKHHKDPQTSLEEIFDKIK